MGVWKMNWIWLQQLLLHWFEIKQVREDDWDENISSPRLIRCSTACSRTQRWWHKRRKLNGWSKIWLQIFSRQPLRMNLSKTKSGFTTVFNRVEIQLFVFLASFFSSNRKLKPVRVFTRRQVKTTQQFHTYIQVLRGLYCIVTSSCSTLKWSRGRDVCI